MKRVLLSWSSGKDSAWALHVLRQQSGVEVIGLLTTYNESADRVAMHAVRRTLVSAQARATQLPLWSVFLPWPCSNDVYEAKMQDATERARQSGVTHFAFGDLFLEDVRAYREAKLAGLAKFAAMRRASSLMIGFVACVSPAGSFSGRRYLFVPD